MEILDQFEGLIDGRKANIILIRIEDLFKVKLNHILFDGSLHEHETMTMKSEAEARNMINFLKDIARFE